MTESTKKKNVSNKAGNVKENADKNSKAGNGKISQVKKIMRGLPVIGSV